MKNVLQSILLAAAIGGIAGPVVAEEEASCLECHEPAEDWEGMTHAEVLAVGMNQKIKMHKDHKELSEEEMKKIIATLLPEAE